MKGIIYKCTNLKDGKIYIGQTINGFENRKKRHIRESKNNSNKNFHVALREFGYDNFKWEIIDTDIPKEDILRVENEYIKKYDSINNGYNMIPFDNNIYLDEDCIFNIIDMLRNTKYTYDEIAEMFNCSPAHIGSINYGDKRRVKNISYPVRLINRRKNLDNDTCYDIINYLKNSSLKQSEIGDLFGVSRKTITDINNGVAHRLIEDECYPIRKERIDNSIEIQEDIIKLILEGKRNNEISKIMNVSPQYIYDINKGKVHSNLKNKYKFPIANMSNKNSKEKIELVCLDILNSSMTLKEVSEKYGISYSSIKDLNRGRSHKDVLEKLNLIPPIRKSK